jgi:hypothetical protein
MFSFARYRSASKVTVWPRIPPLSHLSQTSAQFPPRPVAGGPRCLFRLRSLREKCTTRRSSAHQFRRKECEAQIQPISLVPMKKVVPPRITRFCVAALTFQSLIVFARAQNVGIGTFNNLVGKTLEQAPSPTPPPEPGMVPREGGKAVVEATPCPVPFFSAPTAAWEYDYHLIQMTDVQGLRLDVNEAHASFNFTLASATALSLDYFHVWSDGSNDAGVSQTSNANGIKATFQRTIGTHWIFALPFAFQETNAAGSSVMGSNNFTEDRYVLYPFVVFKNPLKMISESLIFSVSSGYQLVALRQLRNSRAYETSSFDRDSIMKYYLEPIILLKGKSSRCYSPDTTRISPLDRKGAARLYPRTGKRIQKIVNEQKRVLAAVLEMEDLPVKMKQHYKAQIESLPK